MLCGYNWHAIISFQLLIQAIGNNYAFVNGQPKLDVNYKY